MIPKSSFQNHDVLYGFVERVIDGDTIRVRHLPMYAARLWGRRPQPLEQRGISQDTLLIRLYGVDCPELKKRGNPGQPGSEQAKDFTSATVLHTVVKITLLRKDQYARAVAAVECLPRGGVCFKWVPGLGRRDLSVLLAKEGLAELYTSGGAEYWVSGCGCCACVWHPNMFDFLSSLDLSAINCSYTLYVVVFAGQKGGTRALYSQGKTATPRDMGD